MAIPLSIDQLNHVARPTKRLEEWRRFWMDVMGAREISRPGFSFGGCWLYLAGIQIHLTEDAAAPDPPESINSGTAKTVPPCRRLSAVQVRAMAMARRLTATRMLVELIENGIEIEKREE